MTSSETPDPAPAAGPPRRPPGVTALIVITALQGAALLGIGSIVLAARDDAQVQADLEAGATGITVTGAVVAALGAASLIVAVGLLRSSSLARSVCTVLAAAQLATSVYGLIALHEVRPGSLWSFTASIAVLWFLYGSERTQAYFAP